jgi:predicted RNase H-related nuclease YkuK (DUF458 family)
MEVKINLNLNSRQLKALSNGKNIQISPENIGGDMEFMIADLKVLNKINKAISKGKSSRVNAKDLNMVDGGFINFKKLGRQIKNTGNDLQRGLDKVIPRNIQRNIKAKVLDKLEQKAVGYIDGMGVNGEIDGGATYWQRVARRAKNTGNQMQRGLDKVIPREIQRNIKAKALDKLEQKAIGYIAGMGVKKQKKVKLPMSELINGDYQELPSGYLEPNNIRSLSMQRKVQGSSFRGSSFRGI